MADPAADLTKVDFEDLRLHLIDRNDVTFRTDAAVAAVDGGARCGLHRDRGG